MPVANRLGPEGHGFKIAMMGLDGGRINIGACSLGGARACLETASRYVLERKQFGKPLADFQATQFKLADMATDLDAARLLIWRAAALLDQTGEHPAQIKDRVSSPGGTTIAGLAVLEQRGVRGALIDAVVTAAARARELGK